MNMGCLFVVFGYNYSYVCAKDCFGKNNKMYLYLFLNFLFFWLLAFDVANCFLQVFSVVYSSDQHSISRNILEL